MPSFWILFVNKYSCETDCANDKKDLHGYMDNFIDFLMDSLAVQNINTFP